MSPVIHIAFTSHPCWDKPIHNIYNSKLPSLLHFEWGRGHVNYRRLNKVPLPHILCEGGAAVTSGGSVVLCWLMHGVVPPPVVIPPSLLCCCHCCAMLPPPFIIPPPCHHHCHSPSRPLQKPQVPDDEWVLTAVDQGLWRVKGGCIIPPSCPPCHVIVACLPLSHRTCFHPQAVAHCSGVMWLLFIIDVMCMLDL